MLSKLNILQVYKSKLLEYIGSSPTAERYYLLSIIYRLENNDEQAQNCEGFAISLESENSVRQLSQITHVNALPALPSARVASPKLSDLSYNPSIFTSEKRGDLVPTGSTTSAVQNPQENQALGPSKGL